jgi:hypothetical protein
MQSFRDSFQAPSRLDYMLVEAITATIRAQIREVEAPPAEQWGQLPGLRQLEITQFGHWPATPCTHEPKTRISLLYARPLPRLSDQSMRFKRQMGFERGMPRNGEPIPTLEAFLTDRVKPWAESAFAESRPKTWKWYRNETRALCLFKPLARTALDAIKGELVSEFAAWRLREGKQIATVNSSLRVLRRALNLAAEWGVISTPPKFKVLSGERRRERVISREEEAIYLGAAMEPLASIASVLADTGMRPEECFRMRWEHITWLNGRNGALLVTHGKTASARRLLPMTPRVRAVLEHRWIAAEKPQDGWAWPARTKSGHVEPNSI